MTIFCKYDGNYGRQQRFQRKHKKFNKKERKVRKESKRTKIAYEQQNGDGLRHWNEFENIPIRSKGFEEHYSPSTVQKVSKKSQPKMCTEPPAKSQTKRTYALKKICAKKNINHITSNDVFIEFLLHFSNYLTTIMKFYYVWETLYYCGRKFQFGNTPATTIEP